MYVCAPAVTRMLSEAEASLLRVSPASSTEAGVLEHPQKYEGTTLKHHELRQAKLFDISHSS